MSTEILTEIGDALDSLDTHNTEKTSILINLVNTTTVLMGAGVVASGLAIYFTNRFEPFLLMTGAVGTGAYLKDRLDGLLKKENRFWETVRKGLDLASTQIRQEEVK